MPLQFCASYKEQLKSSVAERYNNILSGHKAHLASCTVGSAAPSEGQSGRAVALTTYPI